MTNKIRLTLIVGFVLLLADSGCNSGHMGGGSRAPWMNMIGLTLAAALWLGRRVVATVHAS